MKKYLILASAALVALAACNKEVEIQEPALNNDGAVLTFTSARPQVDADTKTAWDAATSSIIWQSTDKIKVGFTFKGDWWAKTAAYASTNESPNDHKKFYQSSETTIDSESSNIATFKLSTDFEVPASSGEFVFYSVYPAALVGSNVDTAPTATVTLKTSQEPAVGSFDASTDIMVGTSAAITSTGLPSDAIELNWKRVVAHVALTFTNMGFQGTETPTKITLTFNEEAKVAGSFSVNLSNGSIGAGSSNKIVLEGSGLTVDGSSINAWATVLPVSFSSLSVEIKTDKAIYTREIASFTGGAKTFKGNARNTLTINMANVDRTENTEVIADGNYVLAVSSGGSYYAISSSANGTTTRRDRYELPSAFDPTSYSTSSPYTDNSALVWTITNVNGGVQISYAGATNQYMKVGNNALPLDSTGSTFEVTENEGKYVFRNGNRYISMNGTYGFGCYESASYPKDFYAIPASGTPELEIANITLPNGSEVTSPVTITPSKALFINSIDVNGVYSEATCTTEVDWLAVTYSSGSLSYTASANETGASRTAYVSVKGIGTAADTDNVVFSITQPKSVSYKNKWVLVTSVSELAANDKVVIVNNGGTKALGTTQNNNNRNAVDVSLDADDNYIVIINDNVQQLTLGKDGDNWTFYTGSGYLYAASSSSNYLRTQVTNDDNGKWEITIDPTSYVASITAQGTNSHNQLKNNDDLFSCYGSGQTAVKIYKFHEDPNAPVLSVSPVTSSEAPAVWEADNDDTKTFTITATNGTWAYDASGVSSWADVAKNGNELTVTPKAKQASEAHTGSIQITLTPSNAGYENQTANIYLSQAKYSENHAWTLVTDASKLAAGDQIIITNVNATVAAGPQTGNNMPEKEITANTDAATLSSIGDAQVITIGTDDGSWTMSVGSNTYLAATGGSSNNYLKTESTVSNKSRWTITISNDNAVITAKSTGRNTVRYNSSGKIFSCYTSTSQAAVRIYRYE